MARPFGRRLSEPSLAFRARVPCRGRCLAELRPTTIQDSLSYLGPCFNLEVGHESQNSVER
eukprot:1241855-Alexandrium_andersonii.AAC.1